MGRRQEDEVEEQQGEERLDFLYLALDKEKMRNGPAGLAPCCDWMILQQHSRPANHGETIWKILGVAVR